MTTAHDHRRLSFYLDGELTPEEELEVRSHLAACPDCRAVLQGYQRLGQALRNQPLPPLPRGFIPDTYQRIEVERSRGPGLGGWLSRAMPAVVVAALVVAFIGPLQQVAFPPAPNTVATQAPASAANSVASPTPTLAPVLGTLPYTAPRALATAPPSAASPTRRESATVAPPASTPQPAVDSQPTAAVQLAAGDAATPESAPNRPLAPERAPVPPVVHTAIPAGLPVDPALVPTLPADEATPDESQAVQPTSGAAATPVASPTVAPGAATPAAGQAQPAPGATATPDPAPARATATAAPSQARNRNANDNAAPAGTEPAPDETAPAAPAGTAAASEGTIEATPQQPSPGTPPAEAPLATPAPEIQPGATPEGGARPAPASTDGPQVAAVAATEPAATASPAAATEGATPAASADPTVAAPAATSEERAPTPTPAPAYAVAAPFQSIAAGADQQALLGAPAAEAQTVPLVAERFEHGVLLHDGASGATYVLRADTGRWEVATGGAAPAGTTPFATLLGQDPALAQALGAPQGEAASGPGAVQLFQGGTLVAPGGTVYILYADGAWAAR